MKTWIPSYLYPDLYDEDKLENLGCATPPLYVGFDLAGHMVCYTLENHNTCKPLRVYSVFILNHCNN